VSDDPESAVLLLAVELVKFDNLDPYENIMVVQGPSDGYAVAMERPVPRWKLYERDARRLALAFRILSQ
jgi:hypothetical protein